MAAVLRKMYASYRWLFDEMADPRTSDWPFVGSPWPVVFLVFGYLYFVLDLGPRLMNGRKPFKLKKVLILYNALQVICSLHCVREAWICCYSGQYNLLCDPVDYSDDPTSLRVAKAVYFYYLLKILDLLDTVSGLIEYVWPIKPVLPTSKGKSRMPTRFFMEFRLSSWQHWTKLDVFFVLRKKDRQISFLHVYHHAGMVMLTYTATKFMAGGHGVFVGFANSFVHAIMYSYYLVTALLPEHRENIWWKKYITQMQMIQFGMITLHSLQLLWQPSCTYPKFTVGFIVPQNLFMFILFYDFYRRAYRKAHGKTNLTNINNNVKREDKMSKRTLHEITNSKCC